MNDASWLATHFEEHRAHLRAVSFRMLGSLSEAEDAVQEAWLRLCRAEAHQIENLGGWLTTVVARVCLDQLRSRKARREETAGVQLPEHLTGQEPRPNPEQEALLADSVGLALLVVLQTLEPAERLAFVLHDLFAVSFEEIAPLVGRSSAAARQLASRARRRVQGPHHPDPAITQQRAVIEAFLAASRRGDFEALLRLLDPDAVLRSDAPGVPAELRGAATLAARAVKGGARAAQPALVDGAVGAVVAPRGQLLMVLCFVIKEDKIVELHAVSDPQRLRSFQLAILSA